MDKLKSIIKYSVIIFFVLFIGGFVIGSVGSVPKNATVYVDEKTNEFYSPLSLSQGKVTELSLKSSTLVNAELYGYKMNEGDKQNGYFQQEGRSLSGMLLEKIGVLPKLRDRVDSNGDWLY